MSEGAETLGQRLKAERERKGLSTQRAADELHLDAWVVDALESGDYARVGPSVYAKGHLKRYAELLGLPPAEMLEAYDAQSSAPAPAPAAQPATLRMRTSAPAGSEIPWVQIAGFALVALGLVGILWWKPWGSRHIAVPAATAALPNNTANAEPLADPSAESTVSDGAAAVGATAAAVTRTAAPSSEAAVAGAAVPAAVGHANTDQPAGAGRARLRLSFSADAWVDVHDAAGQRVFAGNGHANSVKTVAGAAPLRVYLKSASGVQLEINNHAVAIGPRFVAHDVARFEAGADGVLRSDASTASATGAARPRG